MYETLPETKSKGMVEIFYSDQMIEKPDFGLMTQTGTL
jgi:hypothetical protein